MILPHHAPHFGRDWAHAAALTSDVVTVQLVDRLTMPERAPHVGGQGTHYEVEVVELRPSRVMHRLSAAMLARRVTSALRIAELTHGPIDIVHTHYYHQAAFTPHLPRRWKVVHTEHSLALLRGLLGDQAHYPLSRSGREIAGRAYRRASAVIAVSRFLARSMVALDLPGQPFDVIPNPVAIGVFHPGEPVPGRVAWVGRLSDDKQPGLAIRAFASAASRRPDLRLELIGDGPLRSSIEAQVSDLGLTASVTMHGRLDRPQLADLVRSSELVINSAKVETFSVASAEALCCGTPVVGPDVAAVPELIDADNGLLYRDGDVQGLADGILSVLDQAPDRSAIAARAAERFGAPAVAASLDELYRRVLDGSAGTR